MESLNNIGRSTESETVKTEKDTRIVFKNEPFLSPHKLDQPENVKRLKLLSRIENFLAQNKRFSGQEVSVTFMHSGVSSLVAILETRVDKKVLKIPLADGASNQEGLFLKVWESVGVSVPHVLEEGFLEEDPYLLMSYIGAPSLRDSFGSPENLLDKKIFVEMGKTLSLMHKPKSTGFGRLIDGRPEYKTFGGYVTRPWIQERSAYVQKAGLLDSRECGLEKEVFEVINSYAGQEMESSYCHNDFDPGNIFATDPITVFDPDPSLNHPYMDLAMAMVISVAFTGTKESALQMESGYFAGGGVVDRNFLKALVVIASIIKFGRWYKIKNEKKIKSVQDYLTWLKDHY